MLIHRNLAGNQDIDICSIFKLWESLLSLEERHDTQALYIPVQILLWPNIYLEPLVGKRNVFLVNYSRCNSSWFVFWMGCLFFSLSEWECSGFINSGLVTLSSFWAYFTLNNERWGDSSVPPHCWLGGFGTLTWDVILFGLVRQLSGRERRFFRISWTSADPTSPTLLPTSPCSTGHGSLTDEESLGLPV